MARRPPLNSTPTTAMLVWLLFFAALLVQGAAIRDTSDRAVTRDLDNVASQWDKGEVVAPGAAAKRKKMCRKRTKNLDEDRRHTKHHRHGKQRKGPNAKDSPVGLDSETHVSTGGQSSDVDVTSNVTVDTSVDEGALPTSHCFPALDTKMPSTPPPHLDHWWCPPAMEHAFLGFSYDVTPCASLDTLKSDFRRMRSEYRSRYVRMYGTCDRLGWEEDLIQAAWDVGTGIYPLVWFGFDGSDAWKSRKARLVKAIHDHPKAPFVVRGVVLGSEALFDSVLPAGQLARELHDLESELHPWSSTADYGDRAMQVTTSDMAWSFQQRSPSAAHEVLSEVTVVHANVLPFFSHSASHASSPDSRDTILDSYHYFAQHAPGRKIIYAETGWPSDQSVWRANSADAVSDVAQERDYFSLLDRMACDVPALRNGPQGGLAWFAHIWSDDMLGGWGVLRGDGKEKWRFRPRVEC